MKDCNGIKIKSGQFVLATIDINQSHFAEPYALYKVTREKPEHDADGRYLYLDGAYCFGRVRDRDKKDLMILNKKTNLRSATCYFIKRQEQHNRVNK